MSFCDRLTSLRKETGMNQREFAASINVEASKYNKWETGANRPDYETICMLADRLNVTTDYLLGRTDLKSPIADDIAVHAITGLSEKAIHILADYYARQKLNSITLTVNALLEEGSALGAIARYLYYNLDEKREGKVIPFHLKYRYTEPCNHGDWGDGNRLPFDAAINLEGIDNDLCKQMLQIGVQEQLKKLLEHENKREHASEGGI